MVSLFLKLPQCVVCMHVVWCGEITQRRCRSAPTSLRRAHTIFYCTCLFTVLITTVAPAILLTMKAPLLSAEIIRNARFTPPIVSPVTFNIWGWTMWQLVDKDIGQTPCMCVPLLLHLTMLGVTLMIALNMTLLLQNDTDVRCGVARIPEQCSATAEYNRVFCRSECVFI